MNHLTPEGERLQKIIAQAGITSRRDAEELIRDGLVTVNGKTSKLGDKAVLGKDAIKVKGKLLQTTEAKVYYLFYKPKNVIAMIAEDEEGRPTIKAYTRRIKERVFTVGRMDFTGEGAILLTNDGEMAQKIQKSTDIIRRYHVKVDRNPTQEELAKIARGGRIDGRSMQPTHVRVSGVFTKNAVVEISFQGMGAIEIKKFFENKGFHAERVARVAIGHLNVENVQPGNFKRIEATSIQALFAQPELARKQIERLVKKKAKSYKVVDEESMKKNAEFKKMRVNSKRADFTGSDYAASSRSESAPRAFTSMRPSTATPKGFREALSNRPAVRSARPSLRFKQDR